MKLHSTLGIAIVFCVTGIAAAAAERSWVQQSNEHATLLLQVLARHEPEAASQIGVEGFDEEILDLRRDPFPSLVADLNKAIAEYRRRLAKEPDARVRQDLEILIGAARDRVSRETLDRKYFFPYRDLTHFLFDVVESTIDPRVPLQRQQKLVVRLQRYSGIAKGYRPITDLARARTLERIRADAKLLGPYRGEVEKSLNDFPALLGGMRELLGTSKLTGWEPAMAALERQLSDYNAWIRVQVLARARADHRLPAEVYADNLHQFGLDIAPAELISRALTAFAELRTEMNITAGLLAHERGFPDPDYRAVIRKLKEQQIPANQVMALYRERLAQIEAAVRANRIVTLPERSASIRLATPAENAQLPAPHMSPPRLIGNTGEYGEFVLTTGLGPDAGGKTLATDDFSHQAAAWTLTAHEARPGHELQFAKMIESGVSTARAVFAFNSVNVEGWGLYAEAEMQPYEPLDGQLIALQHRAMRAARAFLDPMVNLGRISPEEVKSFLMDEVCLSDAMATQEVERYTFRAPGQATSYFYGYQRLMETRQTAELALRKDFDRMAFNDFVLAQGLVPPDLLRKAVMEEFVPSSKKH